MTTYIIGKDDTGFVLDRAKLSYPCKVVNLIEETETYYWSAADDDGVKMSSPEGLGVTVDINEFADVLIEDGVVGFVPDSDGKTLTIVFGRWNPLGSTVDGRDFPGFSNWSTIGAVNKPEGWPLDKHAVAYIDEDGYLVGVFAETFADDESSATFDSFPIGIERSGLVQAILSVCGKFENNSVIGYGDEHAGYLAASFEHSGDNAGDITIVGNRLPDNRRSAGVTVIAVRQLGTIVTPGNESISAAGLDWHDIAVDGYGNVTLTLSNLAS
jgi:hypothetical protein